MALIVGLVVATACADERPTCYAGEYIGCSCSEQAQGYARCNDLGTAYGACVCDGMTPGLDAGHDGDADSALFEPCEVNDNCASGLCFTYGDKTMRCSLPCDASSDCPAPSPGCSGMGVCRTP